MAGEDGGQKNGAADAPKGVRERLADHFGAADARREAGEGPVDRTELWGRRIGRALGVVGVLVLLYWLVHQLVYR